MLTEQGKVQVDPQDGEAWGRLAKAYKEILFYRRGYRLDAGGADLYTLSIAAYEKAFPSDRVFPVSARASLAAARGTPQDALAVYDRAFEPVWPPDLVKEYFGRLQAARGLRAFLERARASLAANPADLNAILTDLDAERVRIYAEQQ